MSSRVIKVLALIIGLFAYTNYKLLQALPMESASMAGGTLLLFFSMMAWQLVYRKNNNVYPHFWFRSMAWTGSVLMGLWATFILIALPLDLLQFILKRLIHVVLAADSALPPIAEKSLDGLQYLEYAAAVAFTGLGYLTVARGPQVKTVELPIARLPEALSDLRLVQISDLHVGPTIRKNYVEDVVKRINELDPDLIFLTGDFADGKAHSVASELAPLGTLRSRLGVYFCTGNHEYYWGAEALVETLRSLGVRPLLNENVIVEKSAAKILIGGITDPTGKHFVSSHQTDLRKALSSDQECNLKILLSHQPGVSAQAEELGAHLQLSGHTHSGQFFPFSLLVPLAHRHYRGLNRLGKMWLYINVGTGYWGPPNRLGVASEITLLKLKVSKE